MKKLLPSMLTLIVLLAPIGANAAPLVYSLQVDGLACPFCAYGIEKKLSSIEGVEDIKVNIETGQVIVTMEDASTLTEIMADEKVAQAGFTLRSFSQVKEGE